MSRPIHLPLPTRNVGGPAGALTPPRRAGGERGAPGFYSSPRGSALDLFCTCLAAYCAGYFLGHVLVAVRGGWPFSVTL